MKRTYSALTLAEAMQLVPADRISPWPVAAPPRPPSAMLTDYLSRLQAFDLENTEAAKLLLIDALLVEVVPAHPGLKVWKAMPLETDALTGVADYLLSPDYAYLKSPLLCVAEAKRDDFVQGRAQCVAEMVACRWKNRQEGYELDVHGIVSNGRTWQFYRLTRDDEVFATEEYNLRDLPALLGALDYLCGECARAAATLP
jgi:hypothetical protein